jgi:hypothetical protein
LADLLSEDQQLKLRLMAAGMRVEAPAEEAWRERYSGPLTLAEYATTSGVTVVLPGSLYVNVPLANPGADVPALHFDGDRFVIVEIGREVPVEVVPVPAYHDQDYVDELDGQTYPVTRLGVTHTDRIRVSPIEGCAWKCKFCDLPFELRYRRKSAQQLLDLILTAEHDELTPARHVLISGGTPGGRHEPWIDEVYAFIAARSPLPVDVMMPARADLAYPARLRSVGVNSVSINLEISDPIRAREVTPDKARIRLSDRTNVGARQHYLDYIERAVESFGIGHVQSLMVFGATIEPLDSTLRGVRDLVDRGCVPVLSPFRPHPSTPLGDRPPATFDEMAEVYERTLDICEQADNGVLPGPRCIPCQHNTVTFPLDGPFHVGLDGDLTASCAPS